MTSKINLFEYFLQQLVIWHCAYKRIAIEEFNDHPSNDYSKLKIVKLHFFTCSTDNEALDFFDNFYAMPYGHVESTVYGGLNELNNFSIDNYKLSVLHLNQNYEDLDFDKRNLIVNSIQKLSNKNPNILDYSPFGLVELSHKWFSWQYTFNEARKENSYSKKINPELIKEEAKFYQL